ncbi:glucokinase [candidate division KSB1 bacterium]|nr:glucokinase [candidate division KSB1 bacterium]NIR72748.1 glucokinase [candidate division KSB1 bacterium]NIS23704.1 glucokinase [candidate division KSB1 bacterium]NIT70624.1 glucokinase [candidate division KSB1 bacterium]NIU24352.1 glucokinase [candidate division KSB1 bacterium]
MILVGDVGGTKTRLALYEEQEESLVRCDTETFASRDFEGVSDIVNTFLSARKSTVQNACFGVPGPVQNGEAKMTNLPWTLKEDAIAEATDLKKVKLVNDLVATTAAVPYLSEDELHILYEGRAKADEDAPRAVLAPGTGLGEAFLYSHAGKYYVHASEGGHVDFAPTTDIEVELLQYLRSKFDRVSFERVLCGPGLVNIYSFLRDKGHISVPQKLEERLQNEDPAAVISSTGQTGEFDITAKALDIFVSVLGAQAGNLVLTLLTRGGVYLGGGIPPKIIKKLSEGSVVTSYLNKGRLTPVVENTSFYMIRDDYVALLGAAHIAKEL